MFHKIHPLSLLIALSVLSPLLISCRNKRNKRPEPPTKIDQFEDLKSVPKPEDTNSNKIDKPEEWTIVERVQFDWSGDGKPFDLVAEHTNLQEGGGDFTRVRIFKEGKLVFTFEDKDGLNSIKGSVGQKILKFAENNLLKSKYFLALPDVQNPRGKPLLCIFGYAYASDPGSLHILELNENGLPLEAKYLRCVYLADFTNHNRSIVVGGTSELFGPCFTDYNPFLVYSWSNDPSKGLQIDEGLCKKYNLENYYGWAGLHRGDSVVVVLRPPQGGKPVILPKAEAEALFAKQ